jgi:hypothetical protein
MGACCSSTEPERITFPSAKIDTVVVTAPPIIEKQEEPVDQSKCKCGARGELFNTFKRCAEECFIETYYCKRCGETWAPK